jgi:hypothetical protein
MHGTVAFHTHGRGRIPLDRRPPVVPADINALALTYSPVDISRTRWTLYPSRLVGDCFFAAKLT